METKTCKCCGRELPVESFYKNAFGYTSVCSECHRKKVVEGKQLKKQLKKQVEDAEHNRVLRLSDFTPRELFTELKRRGYEFKATYTETHTISSNDF